MFLLYCSIGLRKSKILNARIIQETRAIIPTNNAQYSTKNSYVSFYNSETEQNLKRINYDLKTSETSIRRWFKTAYKKQVSKLLHRLLENGSVVKWQY